MLKYYFAPFQVACLAVIASTATTTNANAIPLGPPEGDPNFLQITNGPNLAQVIVSGTALSLTKGSGIAFTSQLQTQFTALREATTKDPLHPVQWVLLDLQKGRLIDSSKSPSGKQYGASVSKVLVGAALLDKQNGEIQNRRQTQLLAEMLVVSSNSACAALQVQAGGGDDNRGRETIHRFTQRMGYLRTRGFRGYLGNLHGNELTAEELGSFLYDTYQNRYPGAEAIWKLMHTFRTGAGRANKYLPEEQFIGGKTGTYDGPTVNPETGENTFPDGRPYTVKVRHQILVFNLAGREFGLAILADSGSDESAALLAGGLYQELAR